MLDLATIGIAMETSGLEKGTAALKNAEAAANKTADAADKTSGGFGKLGASSSLASMAVKALGGALAAMAVGSLVKDMAMLASRFETMGVVMRIAGNNAGYTMAQMQGFSKSLQDSGISMLQSRNALTQLATANIDLANASKLARAAQDLAVVGNVNSSEALGRMIHGIKSGEVEILRTLGLNVNFEGSYKKVAAQLGITSDKLTEQQKVLARTDAALAESTRYNGIYEESLTTAGKAIGSLERYWENLKLKMGDAFLPALATSVFALTDALKSMNKELDASGGTVSTAGEALNNVLSIALRGAAVLAATAAYAFRELQRQLGAAAAQLAAFVTLDFKAAGAIGRMSTEDSERDIAATDKFVNRMLGFESVVQEAKKSTIKLTEAERIAAGQASKDAQTASEKEAAAIVKKAEEVKKYAKALKKEAKEAKEAKDALDAIHKAGDKAAQEHADAINKERDAIDAYMIAEKTRLLQTAHGAEEAVRLAQDEYDNHGKLASVIAETTLARLQDQLITKTAGTEAYDALMRQIEAQKQLIGIMQQTEMRDAGLKIIEEQEKAYADMWASVDSTAHDVFVDVANGGQDAFKRIGRTLKSAVLDMLYQMTIKKWIFQIAGSTVGGAAAAAGAASVGSSALGMAGNAASLYSLGSAVTGGTTLASLGGAFSSGFASGAAGLTPLVATSATTGAAIGGATAAASTTGAAAGGAYATLAAVPVAGWIALAVIAAYAIFNDDQSGTYHTGGTGKYNADDGVSYGGDAYSFGMGASEYNQAANESAGAIAMAVAGIIDSASVIAGSDARATVGTGFADDSSDDGAWGGLNIVRDGKTLADWGRGADRWPGREFANGDEGKAQYLAALAVDVRSAIDSIGLPDWAQGYIDALSDGASLEQLATAMDQIKAVEAQFLVLGDVFVGLADLSDGAKSALLKVSGGMEALAGTASAYYDNFYTQEEKANRLTEQTAEAFTSLGLVMPEINDATRDNYRLLIEGLAAQDLSIEANARAYAGALSLQGVMHELAPSFDDVAQAAEDAAQAAEDAAQALEDINKTLLDTATSAADAAMDTLERAVAAERSGIELTRDLASEQVNAITSVFSALKTNVQALYGQVASTSAMQAVQANAFITHALATAQSTGYLPDSAALTDAIAASRSGIDTAVYASQVDADFARLVLAGKLSQLQDISGDQLTEAQRALRLAEDQLEVLDKILESARLQLDAANGIDISVLSVADAIRSLESTLTTLLAVRFDQGLPTGTIKPPMSTDGTVVVGGGGGIATPAGATYADRYNSSVGVIEAWVTDAERISRLDSISAYIQATYDGSAASIAAIAIEKARYNVSDKDFAAASGYLEKDIAALFAGMPSYDIGTNYVLSNGPAYLHEGEAVIPKAYNPAAGGSSGSARTDALIEGLTKEVQRLQAIVSEGNGHASRTAEATNGNPDRPVPIDVVENTVGLATA